MIKINFSHRYDKFPEGFEQSRLIEVIPIKLEALSLPMRLYDTIYDGNTVAPGFYDLPKKGDYMILLLQSSSTTDSPGHLWTTIRSQKGKGGIDKMAYYRSHIGEICECVVTE